MEWFPLFLFDGLLAKLFISLSTGQSCCQSLISGTWVFYGTVEWPNSAWLKIQTACPSSRLQLPHDFRLSGQSTSSLNQVSSQFDQYLIVRVSIDHSKVHRTVILVMDLNSFNDSVTWTILSVSSGSASQVVSIHTDDEKTRLSEA